MTLITKSAAAELLGVSVYTVDRIAAEGGFPMYKIRGSCRFDETEIVEYIKGQRTLKRRPRARIEVKAKNNRGKACGYIPGMKVV